MKKLWLLLSLALLNSCLYRAQAREITDSTFYKASGKWFAAWELVSRKIFAIDSLKPVAFVFFDDRYVYSTSAVSVPRGEPVKGPSLLGRSFAWKRALHKDSITLPDKSRVPVGLMSFASELPDQKDQSFFVMPLPDFWKKAGVSSAELGLDKLVTGVFLHEFAHSQQMQNFGRKMGEFERSQSFGINFTDDIVQHLFKNDTAYVASYTRELNAFYEAAASRDDAAKKALFEKGMKLMDARHHTYFTGKYESLKQIDAFFLTMEGLGQYAMYAWLMHPEGGNLPAETVVKGVRRGGKWWSQDEGLALFLLLAQKRPSTEWAKLMFGTQTISITALLQNAF